MLGTLIKYSALLLAARICWGYLQKRARRRGVPLPPGPRGLPIVGNVLDMPMKEEWLGYQALTKQYGDVVYLEPLGQPIVILGSLRAAIELLEKRGGNVSDRPQSQMTTLCEFDWPFSGMRYGDEWRARRRAFHSVNLPEQVVSYQAGQMADMHLFLRDLLASPQEVSKLNQLCVASIILRIVYGLKLQRKNDPLMGILELFSEFLRESGLPGRFAVEAFPLLRFVPAWMPGAEFKRLAFRARRFAEAARQRPWEELQLALARGEGQSCMASRMLDLSYNVPNKEQVCKDAAGVAYLAGGDTTHTAIDNFIAAMLYFPDVQAKAQAEIDRVVGPERLPSFDDRAHLPYIQAMVLETLRWRTITPLALPHMPIADEVFDGYFIPSGTILMPNAWAMLHDPEAYPDPHEYKPERFLRMDADGAYELDPSVLDPRTIAFGFGRRICPGRHLAENTLWAAAVSLLAVFDIAPAKDASGKPVPPNVEWTSGILSAPRAFDSVITPRTARARALIEEAAEAADLFV